MHVESIFVNNQLFFVLKSGARIRSVSLCKFTCQDCISRAAETHLKARARDRNPQPHAAYPARSKLLLIETVTAVPLPRSKLFLIEIVTAVPLPRKPLPRQRLLTHNAQEARLVILKSFVCSAYTCIDPERET